MEFEKVCQIISEQCGVSADDITMETSFVEDMSLDSLDIFQIISEIEEAFGIEFNPEDMDKIKTVGDAAEYIKKALP